MNDVIISLVSDHGQPYVGSQKDLLSEEKLITPMMFVGGGVESFVSDEIIQNVDYLPSLLKLSGIFNETYTLDGRIPHLFGGPDAREFSFSESIFPNQQYQAAIYNNDHMMYLISKNKFETIKDFCINDCDYRLINRNTNIDETNKHPDLCKRYLDYISNHLEVTKEKIA